MIDREADGSTYHNAPRCLCGSRNQKKAGYLTWTCQACGETHWYRMTKDYGLVAFARETALALDAERAK